jgi:hypothetical protein
LIFFLCGFCRGEGVESLYDNGFLKDSLWWLRSSQKGESWEI